MRIEDIADIARYTEYINDEGAVRQILVFHQTPGTLFRQITVTSRRRNWGVVTVGHQRHAEWYRNLALKQGFQLVHTPIIFEASDAEAAMMARKRVPTGLTRRIGTQRIFAGYPGLFEVPAPITLDDWPRRRFSVDSLVLTC